MFTISKSSLPQLMEAWLSSRTVFALPSARRYVDRIGTSGRSVHTATLCKRPNVRAHKFVIRVQIAAQMGETWLIRQQISSAAQADKGARGGKLTCGAE